MAGLCIAVQTAISQNWANLGNGPSAGVNCALVTNGIPAIGDGADITNVTVFGVQTTITGQGVGLKVEPTGAGARLRCGSQRLEGEGTLMGLWLSSTVEGQPESRFRVMAAAIERVGKAQANVFRARWTAQSLARSGRSRRGDSGKWPSPLGSCRIGRGILRQRGRRAAGFRHSRTARGQGKLIALRADFLTEDLKERKAR